MEEPSFVQLVPNALSSGPAALSAVFEEPGPPTAIMAATDTIALGVLHAAHERGLRVPEDLSVVGFDDIPMASASVPALTTVVMPTSEIVAQGVATALGPQTWLGGGSRAPRVVLRPSLTVRHSTGPESASLES